MRLQGKTALITGGGGGIGRETALLFAREGARVIIADYDESRARLVADEIAASGGQALAVQVDVADPESVERMAAQALASFGGVDILINNAGIIRDRMLHKLSKQEWQAVIDVNLSGVFHCTQALVPQMIERGGGKIINTTSIVGVYGNIGQTNYAAAKAGVIGMTKTWAKELGPKGIRVNAVAPGFIETPMIESVPEKVIAKLRENIPLRRLGKPLDVAWAYLFLASPESDYINGIVLEVNGGLVI